MKKNTKKRLKAMSFLEATLSSFNYNVTTEEDNEIISECDFDDKKNVFKLFDNYIKDNLTSSPLSCFLIILVLENYLLDNDETFEDVFHDLVFGDDINDYRNFMKLLLEYTKEILIDINLDKKQRGLFNYEKNEMI